MTKKKLPIPATGKAPRRLGLLERGTVLGAQKAIAWILDDHALLTELCRLLGIPSGPDQWYELARVLAQERLPKKRGPRNKAQKTIAWTLDDHDMLPGLCRRYGIPDGPTQWYELALALARELAPKVRGRRDKWSRWIDGILVVEIERLVQLGSRRRSAAWATRELAERRPWLDFLTRVDADPENRDEAPQDPAESLRRRYSHVRHTRLADLFRAEFDRCEREGRVAEWDARVLATLRDPWRRGPLA